MMTPRRAAKIPVAVETTHKHRVDPSKDRPSGPPGGHCCPPAADAAPCATGVVPAFAAMYGHMAELPTIAREYSEGDE